jgi:hypothetical protein
MQPQDEVKYGTHHAHFEPPDTLVATFSEWFHAVLYVGADVVQRTFGKAIALAMLYTGKTSFETVFVPTVDEARAWIVQDRARRQRKAG